MAVINLTETNKDKIIRVKMIIFNTLIICE